MNFSVNVVKGPCLHPGLRVCEAFASTLGLTLNATLAMLIVFRTEKELRPYSRVLLYNCCVDGVFSLCAYIFEIHTDVRDGLYVFVNNGFFVGSYERNFRLQCFQIFAIYFTTAVVCIPMIYRYLAVCRQHHMSNAQLVGLVLLVMSVSSTVPLCDYVFWGRASAKTIVIHADVIRSLPCSDPGEIYMFAPAEVFSNFDAVPTLLAAGFVVGSAYGVILFCTLKIRSAAAQGENMSTRRRNLQKQLNCALLVQVINPLILFVVPIGGAVTALLTGFGQLRFFIVTVTTVLSFIPILNPISTIILIKSYRRALWNTLTMGGCRTSIVSSSSDTNSPHPTVGAVTAAGLTVRQS